MGRTFLADYQYSALDARSATGTKTATFTRTTSATNPATYIDSAGVIQLVITEVPRYQGGYYDATGFHAQKGLMIEAARTNLTIYSTGTYYQDDGDGNQMVSWEQEAADFNVGVPVWSVASVPDLTSIVSAKAQRFQVTGAGSDNGNVTIYANTSAVGAGGFAATQNDYFTLSCWVRTQTGITGADVIMRLREDGTGTPETKITITPTSSWSRFSVSHKVTAADTTQIFPVVQVGSANEITAGDVVDCEVALIQVEKNSYATSFIPTTTASLTRNKETLKYEISGNRTATVESCIAKVAPAFSAAESAGLTWHTITSSDTDRRYLGFSTAYAVAQIYPNVDQADSTVGDLINEAWGANTEMTLGYIVQHSSPYIVGYYNGVADGTSETSDDFSSNAWGTYFWVATDDSSDFQLNGTIFWIAFFDEALSAVKIKFYSDRGWKRRISIC